MNKRVRRGVAALAVLSVLGGCASNQTMSDEERTKGEGAGLGALIGAVIGYQLGDEKGAVIGAALGAGAGYAVGSEVAERKKQYATTEDFLEAEIQRTEEFNATALAYHEQLRDEITAMDAETQALRARYDAGKANKDELKTKKQALENRLAKAGEMQEVLQNEYDVNAEVLKQEGGKRGDDDPYIARLREENATLKAQIETLRQDSVQLAAINERLSI